MTKMPAKYPIKIGIIGGSGLNDPEIFENRKEHWIETPYGKPSDCFIEGTIQDVPCILLARHGRKHSLMPSNINFRANIWGMKILGCTHLIVSTATGSLQEHIKPGDFVILDSFIDRTTKRIQTFYDGQSDSPPGICHLPMDPAFCPKTRQLLIETAEELNYTYHSQGTCVAIEGPRFSSKAESLMFRQWGADVINMTTVPEVVLAREAGLCYAAVAMATDFDCWRDSGEKVSVPFVLETMRNNAAKVVELFKKIVPKIAAHDWEEYIDELKKTVESSVMLPK